MTGDDILALVARYHRASTRRLHLVPSESALSATARLPYLSDLAHRYSFPADGPNWAWPGNDDLAAIEHATVAGLRVLLGARHVNVKPVSGLNAMTVAISALSERGGTVLSIGEADGGHGSTRFITHQLGLSHVALPYDQAYYRVDVDRLQDLMSGLAGPVLVYLDQFMCLFPHDLPAIRAAVGPDALICYDGSHVLGLIAGGKFQNPLAEGADCLVGSTHKTLPGPHNGVVATIADHLAKRVDEHAGHWVSHHHPADMAALAITVADLRTTGREYAARTIANAQYLAARLTGHGFAVCAAQRGFTASHQLWIDVAPIIDPIAASRLLLDVGIVVNAVDVPYLATGAGLRLGVQEVSRRGMDLAAMDEIAAIISAVLIDRADPAPLTGRVHTLLDTHPAGGDDLLLQLLDAVTDARVGPR